MSSEHQNVCEYEVRGLGAAVEGGGKELRASRKLDVMWYIQKGSGPVRQYIYGPVCFGSSPGNYHMTHALAAFIAACRSYPI